MKKLISTFILIFISFAANAFDQSSFIYIKNKDENVTKYKLLAYKNKHNSLEFRQDATGFPNIMSGLNPTILYGRDLNDNGKIDTWFVLKNTGVEVYQHEGSDELGKDILEKILNDKFQTSANAYLSTATTTVLSYLFFTFDDIKDENNNFYQDWIDLEELSIRLEHNVSRPEIFMTQKQVFAQRELISFGFKELANKMDTFGKRDIYGDIALDVTVWFAGGAIIKYGGKLLATPIKYLSETTLIKYISENLNNFALKQQEVLANKINKIREKINLPNKKMETNALVVLSAKTWRKDVAHSVRAHIIKKRLSLFTKKTLEGIKHEWKYIVLSASLQTGVEATINYDTIKDPNPAIMAQNLFENKHVVQNLAYLTMDTTLMSGVSNNFKSRKAKILACGMVALVDSSFINLVVKDEVDYKRVALDTSWEMIIGNAQVQADLLAISYFEKLSINKQNPKLKVIGYAIAFSNAIMGSTGYSFAAKSISPSENHHNIESKEQEKIEPILVPVFAEM